VDSFVLLKRLMLIELHVYLKRHICDVYELCVALTEHASRRGVQQRT